MSGPEFLKLSPVGLAQRARPPTISIRAREKRDSDSGEPTTRFLEAAMREVTSAHAAVAGGIPGVSPRDYVPRGVPSARYTTADTANRTESQGAN